MKAQVLTVAANQFSEIPRELWAQHVQLRAKKLPEALAFMTEDHHLVRYFVVRELPRLANPSRPSASPKNLTCHYQEQLKFSTIWRKIFFSWFAIAKVRFSGPIRLRLTRRRTV